MGRFDKTWNEAEKQGQLATESIFLNKRLKNDRDKVYVAFLEPPEFGTTKYKDGTTSRRAQMNVAVFTKDLALEYYEDHPNVMILEFAPKHMNRIIAKIQKPRYGMKQIYEIDRFGVAQDTQVAYELEPMRELTNEEIKVLETVKLHPLFSRKDDDATGDNSEPKKPLTDESRKKFADDMHVELQRLGWTKDDYITFNKGFFQSHFLDYNSLTEDMRQAALDKLQELEPGAKSSDNVGFYSSMANPVNLDADTEDFF